MSDLQRLQNAFMAADQRAQQGDEQAAEDARAFAAEIRRLQAAPAVAPEPQPAGVPDNGLLGQFNRGVAGFVDLVNPFDKPHMLNPFPEGTGSAADWMRSANIAAATEDPEGIAQSFARGAGEAAGALLPVAKGAQMAASAPGLLGMVADDIARPMMTTGGALAEVTAGGVSRAAEQAAEDAGLPEWVQTTAAIAAPAAALPAGVAATKTAANLTGQGANWAARKLPVAGYAMRVADDVRNSLFPMSEAGATGIARERVQSLMGGPERAREVGATINPQDEFGRTPAQQVQDPNLLGLERAAMDEDALARERIEAGMDATRDVARGALEEMGGDPERADRFFTQRVRDFRRSMTERIDRAIAGSEARVTSQGPQNAEVTNSTRMVQRLRAELDDALDEERTLWASIPLDVPIGTENTARAIRETVTDIDQNRWAQRRDIPKDLRAILEGDSPIGEQATGTQLHSLYSEMRRVARSAMAGNDQNRNTARIANAVAEAVLEDMDAAVGAGEQVGPTIGHALAMARDFSRTMHEKFDQGAVGRILRRTLDGDEVVTPEAALDRTVGRGGSQALADNQSIRTAAPGAAQDVQDYLRSRFSEAMFNGSGEFTARRAREWMRNNREVLNEYPGLKGDLQRALQDRDGAQGFAIRAQERIKLADHGPIRDFQSGKKAITAVLGARNPAQAAASIAATARKDASGEALAGVKGVFSDYLTEDLSRLPALLDDKKSLSALRRIFDAGEMKRLAEVRNAVDSLSAPSNNVGEVLNSPVNTVLETFVRVFAAQQGGKLGAGAGMGGSLQTANIFSGRAQEMLKNLTNSRARQIVMEAIEDPDLMKTLLTEVKPDDPLPESVLNKLAPYLVGTAATQATQTQE